MAGLYFEQFLVGHVFKHAVTKTVTEMDNTLFSVMTLNMQPLHLDAHFSEQTEFGQRLVNSLFTLGLVIGLSVQDTTFGTTVANLGMSETTFPKPVFAGDTIRAETTVRELRESRSRPGQGIVTFEHVGLNQRDEVVCRTRRGALMHKRPAGLSRP